MGGRVQRRLTKISHGQKACKVIGPRSTDGDHVDLLPWETVILPKAMLQCTVCWCIFKSVFRDSLNII